jgi:serine/threonine protein phosphatase PrpC
MELKAYYTETTNGPYLELNEDQVITDLPNKFFGVIDGFGGVGIGDKASEIVAQSMKNLYVRVGGDVDATLPFYYSEQGIIESNALVNSLFYAQNELKKHFEGKDLSNRGGASILCGVLSENLFVTASVGNCMGILVRNGKVIINSAPDVLDAGVEGGDKHFRTTPLSALGLYSDFKFHVNEIKLKEGDIYALLTDGCYSRLNRSDFKSILLNSELMLNEMGEALLDRANDLGNLDNQSVVLLEF